jgi:hypothetical protein
MAMLLIPAASNPPARRFAIAGAALELTAAELLRKRLGMLAEPYEQGRSGRLMKVASRMTAASAVVSWIGRRSRMVSALCGATYVAASAITRFGVFEAGLASARDPKYIVVPQRERVAARQAGLAQAAQDSAPDHAVEEQHEPGEQRLQT